MITRILPINGLRSAEGRLLPQGRKKGLQWLAPLLLWGERQRRTGYRCGEQTPCKGKRTLAEVILLPMQGEDCTCNVPRAVPWADSSLPLRGVIG